MGCSESKLGADLYEIQSRAFCVLCGHGGRTACLQQGASHQPLQSARTRLSGVRFYFEA